MLQLNYGTFVPVTNMAPTQGLVFALKNPGKSQMCKNAPCPHGAECNFLHLKAEPQSPAGAKSERAGSMLLLEDGTFCSRRRPGSHAEAIVRPEEPRQLSDVQERTVPT
jgi:hypothetical protein